MHVCDFVEKQTRHHVPMLDSAPGLIAAAAAVDKWKMLPTEKERHSIRRL